MDLISLSPTFSSLLLTLTLLLTTVTVLGSP